MKLIKNIIKPLYFSLPPTYRQPKEYAKMHKFYQDAQWWPELKIEQWQLTKLKDIVNYAYNNVPGYYQLYKEAGINPEEIRCLNDIKYLPFTDKFLIRDNISDFISNGISKRKMSYCTTGGSTGIPFGFYYNKLSSAIEYAFMYNAWETTGWRLNDVGVVLRGGFVGSKDNYFSKTQSKRYELSTYYLTEDTYSLYKKFILKVNPTFLHAYPSSATDFARMVIQFGDIGQIDFKSIFLGSENLYTWQKSIIKQAFPTAKIMSWYGHTERAIWAPWCDHEEKFHVSPFYGYTEILDGNNIEIEEGETGELVGTSFWMKATPFIRYKTLDYATKGALGCQKCGRRFQIIDSIDGRLQEIIISKSERRISMTAINMHDNTFDEVSQFRFIQDRPGELILTVVPKATFTFESEQKIINSIRKKIGDDFILKMSKVDQLPRTSSGKYTFLEQNIIIERSDRATYSES